MKFSIFKVISHIPFIKDSFYLGMDWPVVPLHENWVYKTQCAQLLNDEWERSETARLRSLESSRDNLPTCLILLKEKNVIGHCKLTPIPSIPDACFVESVVIDKKLRGQGFGSYLMIKAEEYCREKMSLNTIYLSTKGQEVFYSKLGYDVCAPISIYGNFARANAFQSKIPLSNPSGKTYMNKKL